MLRDKRSVTLAILAAGALLFAVTAKDPYDLSLVNWISLNALLATALRFVLLVGETNVATAAFFGIGAYAAGVSTAHLGLPFPIAIIGAGLVAAIVSAGFGYVTLRVIGPYFMLISFAFTEVLRLIYTQVSYLGGNSGLVGIYPPRMLDPWMSAVVVTIAFGLIIAFDQLERSVFGRIFAGVHVNPRLMETLGFDVHLVKLGCVVIASFAAGLAGGLQAFTANVISPGDFGYVVAVFALAYVKIGGEAHVLGAVIGAALLTIVSQALQGAGAGDQIVFGAVIVGTILFFPGGILAGWERLTARFRRPREADVRRNEPTRARS